MSWALFIFATNQIHKWAHEDRPPAWVARLQRWNMILSPEHHAVHHTAPYDRHYCITVGWMNPVLNWLRFFRTLEWITMTTLRWQARQDDLGVQGGGRVPVRRYVK